MTDQQQQHPITPPPELIVKWIEERQNLRPSFTTLEQWLTRKAARWGYEQRGAVNEAEQQFTQKQLQFLSEILWAYTDEGPPGAGWASKSLEKLREDVDSAISKPKSQAEEALKAIGVPTKIGEARVIEHHAHDLVRAALERLRELEERP